MTDIKDRGATPEEWFHFDFVLGLGENLLPCVPAGDDVKVVKGSALEGKVGKIPSAFNSQGEAHGLAEWQKRPILSNEIQLWSQDRRLNICVRTGPISGVYALDVDVEDAGIADTIGDVIGHAFSYEHAERQRENSHKFLVPFRLEGGSCKKRKIKLDKLPKGPAIELLADGQQFVAAGSHSSGVRYQWRPSLPESLPTLTLDQLNQLWTELTSRFAMESSSATATTPSTQLATTSPSGTPTAQSNSSQSAPDLLTELTESDWQQLLAALRHMLTRVADNDTWSQIGYALLSLQRTRPAEQLWYDFSRKAVGYEEGAPEAWWKQHWNQTPRSDYRHIFTLARKAGWGATSSPDAFPPVERSHSVSTGSSAEAADGPDGPEPTDGTEALDVAPPPLPDKPIVQLVAANFSQIVHQLETIFVPEAFVQGKTLVRLSPAHDDAEIERSQSQLMLIEVTKAFARTWFGDHAVFQRFKPLAGTWYNVDPSAEHINTLIELGGWKKLRPLTAIARAPFLRRDGSICDVPGYDKTTGALYKPGAAYPEIPRSPVRGDAAAALGRLRGIFHQFPWQSELFESAFLAHVLSECGRLAFPKCPMFFYSAPSAGTGKSLLQSAAAIIAHGTIPAKRPWVSSSNNGEEIRKTVFASLLKGDRSLLFDNVPEGVKIRSPELCAVLTTENWTDRKLGESDSPGVPNRAVFSASGNNVNPAGDLSRRSIVIRLDANTEHLEARVFDIKELETYLVENRPSILVDVLTILKAYHNAEEKPAMPPPLPSFEGWSHFVREPLIWLGLPDPVETQKREGADEDRVNLKHTFDALIAHFGAGEFSSTDIARTAGSVADSEGKLTRALIDAGCSEPQSPSKVGYWLRGNRDKVFSGMKLVSAGVSALGVKWKFVIVQEKLT